jgi:hypothetical protein
MPVTCALELPNLDHLFDHIRENAGMVSQVVAGNTHTGRTLTLCGAGPSLAENHSRLSETTDVWACNSALPYLADRGLPVTHGFTVDQGEEMLGPVEWARTFDVVYLVGSSVSPKLAKHLRTSDRRLVWFHNYLGLKNPEGWTGEQSYEFHLYCSLYPPAPQVGYGLNAVPRALCLALWMGYDHIQVIGADCAAKPNGNWMPPFDHPSHKDWLASTQLYADGRSALDAFGPSVVMVQSEFESVTGDPSTMTRWHTRPDMVISAMHMAQMAKQYAGRVELVGNTLPNAMTDKSEEWLATIPQLTQDCGVAGFEPAYSR